MEIRAIHAEETEEMLSVLCEAFALPLDAARPIFYADPFFDLSHKRLLRAGSDEIASCLTVIPSCLRVGAAWVPLGGIAGVATRPKLRDQGYASNLLAATVGALADELHYPVSGLFAHSEGMYRQLGWELTSYACRRSVPIAPLSPMSHQAHAATENDWERIHALHASRAGEHTGGCLRDERRWRIIEAAGSRECTVLKTPDGCDVIGYVFWERHEDVLHILELCAATQRVGEELLGFLRDHQSGADRLEWSVSASQWNACGFSQFAGTSVSEPGLMLRLTDLRAAFTHLHGPNLAPILAATNSSLTLRAADPLRADNNCPWRLTPHGVTPGQATDMNWIAGDIRAFASIYLGSHTPSEHHALGDLTASSSTALALADRLFPLRDPFISPLDQF
jgi:predicted acetyltransferase